MEICDGNFVSVMNCISSISYYIIYILTISNAELLSSLINTQHTILLSVQ